MTKTASSKTVGVPAALYWRTRFFAATAGLWRQLAGFESAVLREALDKTDVQAPIYVTGVPRAGTTITTEMIERHPDVTSHRYSDFPNVYTPFWRNWLAQRSRPAAATPEERSHGDRILVTTESPEAIEEVIWMQFFEGLHDEGRSHVLDAGTRNEAFERYYRDHIRKLLLVRDAQRYLAKGNYNITRLAYLRTLFPDARFVVVVRHPVSHIASLLKQDLKFQEAGRLDRRVTEQLMRSGHFEFGPKQRVLHTGDSDIAARIRAGWDGGNRVEAWSHYWASAYAQLLDQLARDDALAGSTLVVRYEDLCRTADQEIRRIIDHCSLAEAPFEPVIRDYRERLSEPTYYRPEFSEEELDALRRICTPVAERFGYDA